MTKQKKTGGQLHGIFALFLLMITTILGFIPVFFIGILKLFPNKRWQAFCTKCVDAIAMLWSDVNNFYLSKTHPMSWDIEGIDNLSQKSGYLVVANHQSWLDIVILQRLFNRKIPVLKFFIKDQLKWIPLLGFAWWAMGCPFMKRYSKEYLAKKPHKKGNDLKSTQKAVDLFKYTPTSIMNFIEGTRYTTEKKLQQNSPYKNLLKPKAGGISFVISTMGKQINSLLDVTIVYPKQHSLWNFLCRRMDAVKIHVRHLPIPEKFITLPITNNEKIQFEFREWLNKQWAEKDRLITSMKSLIDNNSCTTEQSV